MARSDHDPSSETDHMDRDGLVEEENSGSRNDVPDDEELALRIAIQRSQLDTGECSSSMASIASSPRSCRRNVARARLSTLHRSKSGAGRPLPLPLSLRRQLSARCSCPQFP